MNITEAKLASVLRKTLGRSVRVVLGKANRPYTKKSHVNPIVYLSLGEFIDLTEHLTGSMYTGRRMVSNNKIIGFNEERPGQVKIHIEIICDDYSKTQALKQKLLGPAYLFVDSITTLILNERKDSNIQMLFTDISPALQNFKTSPVDSDQVLLYSGTMQFNLNGFLHINVRKNKPTNAKAKLKLQR